MIIDCHGHYTTEPKDLHRFRKEQTEAQRQEQVADAVASVAEDDATTRSARASRARSSSCSASAAPT